MRKTSLLRFLLLSLVIFPVWSCQGQESVPEVQATKPGTESFGRLVHELSGKPGYFDTDNLISNESSYLHVIPQLESLDIRGGAYLGVGPDQNFSYIAHIKPSIAFIVDIRRDNMLTHLLYKALFELSDDRLDFLGHLFARELDESLASKTTKWDVQQLMTEIEKAPLLEKQQAALHKKIKEKVTSFGVDLSEKDLATIHRFHNEFITQGPNLRFTSHNRSPRAYYPTYEQLMSEEDINGESASYLSNENLFQFLKQLHESDKIIPVMGNFAAPEAIPAIGAYLKKRGERVTSFYTSNVEYYLMYQGLYPAYLENIKQLPLADNSVIIRSYFNRFRSTHPLTVPGYASTQLLQYMETMIAHPNATYSDLIFEHFVPRK